MSESKDQPIERRPERDKLEELEPHQAAIERAADVYFSACRTLARTINRIKDVVGDDDGR